LTKYLDEKMQKKCKKVYFLPIFLSETHFSAVQNTKEGGKLRPLS
jgi:hypothetical protein